MTDIPPPLDPIAQLVAKYESNGHHTIPIQQQPAPQAQQKKGWTGFAKKTLWDWLNLLGVLLVPLILGVGTIIITAQQSSISQSQHESDLSIANNEFQEALLKTFRDDISHLVFDQHLLTAKQGNPVQIIAQSYTNDALRKLDLSRRVLVIRFLSDMHLVVAEYIAPTIVSRPNGIVAGFQERDTALISLSGVDLSGAELSNTDLHGTDLHGADLSGTDLSEDLLRGADLSGADLHDADLSGADLSNADLSSINLSGADLAYANLRDDKVLLQNSLLGTDQLATALAEASDLDNAILPDGSNYPSRSYPLPQCTFRLNWFKCTYVPQRPT